MKIEFCKEKLPYTTQDVFRRIAVDHRYIGEIHRSSNQELWCIEIRGKRITTDTSDRFSLTEGRKLIKAHLQG